MLAHRTFDAMRGALSVLTGLVGLALFMAVVWAGCSTFLKNNGAYERGVATALIDPVVAKALGAPVRESWFLNGSIEGDGMTTRGSWLVRLRGERAGGTLRIAGYKADGDWRVVSMALDAEDVRYVFVPGVGFRAPAEGSAVEGPPDILGD